MTPTMQPQAACVPPAVRLPVLEPGYEPYPGYQLRCFRGRGGFGEVWEACTRDGQEVALKFLPCNSSLAAAQETRCIQIVSRLHHPNIIRLEQIWCCPGYLVVAMELADGSLLELLEACFQEYGTPMAPALLCGYLTQAASALDFLNTRQHLIHNQRVALQHCDIKPSNLLLVSNVLKVSDFGLVSLTTSLLKQHRQAGTPEYSAPEVLQGRLSNRTDQYSLAVTYYHLRTGCLPFPSEFSDRARHDPDLRPLSVEERPILARALAFNPRDRWPSCLEMMQALEQAVARNHGTS